MDTAASGEVIDRRPEVIAPPQAYESLSSKTKQAEVIMDKARRLGLKLP